MECEGCRGIGRHSKFDPISAVRSPDTTAERAKFPHLKLRETTLTCGMKEDSFGECKMLKKCISIVSALNL